VVLAVAILGLGVRAVGTSHGVRLAGIAGTVAMSWGLLIFGQSSAGAADADTQVGGSLTLTTKVTQQQLPPGLALQPGQKTLTFGEGCAVGSDCTVTFTDPSRQQVQQSLSGGGVSWRTSVPVNCLDTLTGAVSTPHGADFVTVGHLTPTAFAQRDGIQWVTRMSGTMTATATINAAGRAADCTIPPNQTVVARDTATLTAVQVPLPSPAPVAPAVAAAVDPEETRSEAVIDEFILPLSDSQAESRQAVAEGRRSTFPASLTTPADAVQDLGSRLPRDLLLVALLGLLMVFPAQLFNSTYEENHERIDAVLGRVLRRRTRAAPPSRARRVAIFAGCLVAGTLLGGLLDPHFGFDRPSTALVLGICAAVLVGLGTGVVAARGFRRVSHQDGHWYLHAIPSALIVAGLCVVVSRLTHFQPGYLYGVLGGAVFVAALTRRDQGRAELTGMLAGLVLAVGAWFLFAPVSQAANEMDASIAVLASDAFLAALFVGGLEGMLFSLFPLRFLPGGRLAAWSWWAWALLTAVVLFVFVHVLLMPATGYLGRSTTASVSATIALFVVFAVISVVFWLWFRLRPDPRATEESVTTETVRAPDHDAADRPTSEVPLQAGSPAAESGVTADHEATS